MAFQRATVLSSLAAIAAAVTALTPGSARAAVLGTIGSAEPSCPADCLVEARVTAFSDLHRAPAEAVPKPGTWADSRADHPDLGAGARGGRVAEQPLGLRAVGQPAAGVAA